MKKTLLLLLFTLLITTVSFAQDDSLKIFTIVDQMPQYEGGDSALRNFLQTNIHYPKEVLDNPSGAFPSSKNNKGFTGGDHVNQGTVYLTFYIDTNGIVKDIKLLRSASFFLDAEAIRVVKSMPKWIPGKQNGNKVNVQYNLPVQFSLTTHTTFRDFTHDKNYRENGIKFLNNKEYEKAIESFTQSIKEDKKDIDSYYNRAVCYFKIENNAAGCADLQKAADLGDKASEDLFIKLCSAPPASKPDTVVKQNIVENPSFEGGNAALSKYIDENLAYPEEAKKKRIDGTVETAFTIDENGKIKDAKIVKGIEESCDAEALRFISSMPDWIPGKQNGRPASFEYNLPLQFFKKK